MMCTSTLFSWFMNECRAVGIGGSGNLYVGCNLEFANLPLYNSVHAEQFLLVNALHHRETRIEKLAISAAPCGHCRQFFSELNCAVRWVYGCENLVNDATIMAVIVCCRTL